MDIADRPSGPELDLLRKLDSDADEAILTQPIFTFGRYSALFYLLTVFELEVATHYFRRLDGVAPVATLTGVLNQYSSTLGRLVKLILRYCPPTSAMDDQAAYLPHRRDLALRSLMEGHKYERLAFALEQGFQGLQTVTREKDAVVFRYKTTDVMDREAEMMLAKRELEQVRPSAYVPADLFRFHPGLVRGLQDAVTKTGKWTVSYFRVPATRRALKSVCRAGSLRSMAAAHHTSGRVQRGRIPDFLQNPLEGEWDQPGGCPS